MGQFDAWRPSALRCVALFAVLALHGAVLALLLEDHRGPVAAHPSGSALQLLYLPPAKAPKMLAASTPPKHLLADVGISVAPPSMDGLSAAAPLAQTRGGGAGVDWAAEARRALLAYEIRRDQGVEHASLGLTPWDGWLPAWQRRPGERVRTSNGDWIVWINGRCYEIASWHPGTSPGPETAHTPAVCVEDAGAASGASAAIKDPPAD